MRRVSTLGYTIAFLLVYLFSISPVSAQTTNESYTLKNGGIEFNDLTTFPDVLSVANIHEVRAVAYDLKFEVKHEKDDTHNRFRAEAMSARIRMDKVQGAHPTHIYLDADGINVTSVKFNKVMKNNLSKPSLATIGGKFARGQRTIKEGDVIYGYQITLPDDWRGEDGWYVTINYTMDDPYLTRGGSDGVLTALSAKTGYPVWFSQNEPMGARKFFPCQDSPTVRSSIVTTFNTKADENVRAWATGKRVLDIPGMLGTGTFRFVSESDIPVYLYAMVVGVFEEYTHDGFPGYTFVGEGPVDDLAVRSERALTPLVRSKELYEEWLAFPMPYSNMKVYLTPNEFPFLAMENQAFIFIGDAYTLADAAYLLAHVMPHENVHHWFGNLITAASWPHVGVNEGPTTYYHMRYLQVEGHSPAEHTDAWLNNFIFRMSKAKHNFDRDPHLGRIDGPWSGSAFPANFHDNYEKGAFALREAETLVSFGGRSEGQRRMDKALSAMLHDNDGKPRNMTVAEFYLTAGEKLDQVLTEELGIDVLTDSRLPSIGLGPHMAELLQRPGMPFLTVSCEYDDDRYIRSVTIEQDDRTGTYALAEVPIVAYGLTGRFPFRVNLDRGISSVSLDVEDFVLGEEVTSLFIDPEASRWIQTNHCFGDQAPPMDKEFRSPSHGAVCEARELIAVEDMLPHLKPTDARTIETIVAACNDDVYRRAVRYFDPAAGRRNELAQFTPKFQIGVEMQSVDEPFHMMEDLLRSAIATEDFARAFALLDVFIPLGFADVDGDDPAIASLLQFLREQVRSDAYPTFRYKLVNNTLALRADEHEFLWQALVDVMQYGPYNMAKVSSIKWMDAPTSPSNREANLDQHMKMRQMVQASLDAGEIQGAYLVDQFEKWIAGHEKQDKQAK